MTWFLQALKQYGQPSLLRILILGFSSGLPLALSASNLTVWLTEEGLSMSTIGVFAAIGTPYTIKFLWSHAVDHLPIPPLTTLLGKRRGWIFFTQLLLMVFIAGLGLSDPNTNLLMVALFAFGVASASATQDIAVDAFRIESVPQHLQGEAAAMAVFGYRLGMLVAGAGGLLLAESYDWSVSYLTIACFLVPCMVVILFAPEPSIEEQEAVLGLIMPKTRLKLLIYGLALSAIIYAMWLPTTLPHPSLEMVRAILSGAGAFIILGFLITVLTGKSLRQTTLAPFSEFTQHHYWWVVLIFIVLFKFGDAFAGVMTNPFLIDIGFAKSDLALVVKTFGFAALIIGAIVGGAIVEHIGNLRSLWVAGILQMLSNLVFCVQAYLGVNLPFLFVTIGLENFTGAMGTAAFVSYMSSLCMRQYSATQYALLSSLAAWGRTFLVSLIFYVDTLYFPGASFIDTIGWANFFILTTIAAIPGLVLLYWLQKRI